MTPKLPISREARERCAQREQEERARMALALIIPVDRKLAEQCHRHRVGFVTLLRFRQEGPLDLSGTQRNVADDLSRDGIADDVGA